MKREIYEENLYYSNKQIWYKLWIYFLWTKTELIFVLFPVVLSCSNPSLCRHLCSTFIWFSGSLRNFGARQLFHFCFSENRIRTSCQNEAEASSHPSFFCWRLPLQLHPLDCSALGYLPYIRRCKVFAREILSLWCQKWISL